MTPEDISDLGSSASGIAVEECADRVTLTLYARNRLVSWIASLAGAVPAAGTLLLAANGLRVSDGLTVVVMLSLALGILWLTWRIGSRKRAFTIVFHREGLEVGPHSIAYSDILSCGLGRDGGDAYDPASMRVPRNYTAGPYVFVQVGERRMPITVGLEEAQARHALAVVAHYLGRFGAR